MKIPMFSAIALSAAVLGFGVRVVAVRGRIEPLQHPVAALVLIDHFDGRAQAQGSGAGRGGQALNLPIIVTTTARDSMWDPASLNSWKH